MTKRRVHIGNLRIRLPRSAAGDARAVAGELGRELLKNIAHETAGRTGRLEMGDLSAPPVKLSEAGSVKQAASQAVGNIARAVKGKAG
jgi:hypothetical protein